MAIQAINCPGYYELGDGRLVKMMQGEERFFERAVIQEIGEKIRVLCASCINGTCVAGVGERDDSGLEGTGRKGAKQTKCIYLK